MEIDQLNPLSPIDLLPAGELCIHCPLRIGDLAQPIVLLAKTILLTEPNLDCYLAVPVMWNIKQGFKEDWRGCVTTTLSETTALGVSFLGTGFGVGFLYVAFLVLFVCYFVIPLWGRLVYGWGTHFCIFLTVLFSLLCLSWLLLFRVSPQLILFVDLDCGSRIIYFLFLEFFLLSFLSLLLLSSLFFPLQYPLI